MSSPQYPDRGSEWPRHEPEILSPDDDDPSHARPGIWIRIHERDGMRRVFIARPSLPSVILALLIFGLIAAVVMVVLAGVVLLWIPILIAGIIAALLAGTIRYYWARLRNWMGRR